MGFSAKPSPLPFLCLSLSALLFLPQVPLAKSGADYLALVYKGLAKQALDRAGVYSQSLSDLFESMESQSAKSKFFKTTSGSGKTRISGHFQCRGDLSNTECFKCVSMLTKLYGGTIAASVQLSGCSFHYEVYGFTGFNRGSGKEMRFKKCGGTNVAGTGFQERRDTALSALANSVVSGHGFYKSSNQGVHMLGQCAGYVDLGHCGECVNSAAQKAQRECENSISGEIYLQDCFVSYGYPSSSSSSGKSLKTVVAIPLGVGFLVICSLIAWYLLKK